VDFILFYFILYLLLLSWVGLFWVGLICAPKDRYIEIDINTAVNVPNRKMLLNANRADILYIKRTPPFSKNKNKNK